MWTLYTSCILTKNKLIDDWEKQPKCIPFNIFLKRISYFLAITLAGTTDIEFVSPGIGAVAFLLTATESEQTGVISAKEDTDIEDVECVTITLGLGDFAGTDTLGAISTAEVCVLDGTG